jgi:enoyl-CoA hydratase/carnithine racemase
MPTLTTERHGPVWIMGLNRAAKRNAFDPDLFHSLARAYGELERDPELRCGVVFGHGDHFTAGIDLAQYSEKFKAPGDAFALNEGEMDPFNLRTRMSKPVVMAAHGISFTIAIEMMLGADIRIAARGVRFGQLEIARGLYPLGGATFRLVREAGWGNAMRWLLTAEEFGADEALRIGLIQDIVEPGEHLARAVSIAERVAAQAPLGVRATLRSAWTGVLEGEAEAYSRMRDDLPQVLASEDFAEGVASFRERRAARFQGK